MVTKFYVNISPGNSLLTDGTKSLPEPIVDLSVRAGDINLTASS